MIQRIALHTDLDSIIHYFKVVDQQGRDELYQSKYNISPTQNAAVIMNNRQHIKVVTQARWGLFPYWAPNSVNTTGRAIVDKSYLNQLAKRNRCIIPCTGFYGQKQFSEEKEARAMHIVKPGQSIFGIAAIYDTITGPNREEVVLFSLLTEPMTGPMSTWQDRTPLIVHEQDFDTWLDRHNRSVETLISRLDTLDSYQLKAYPVTNQINNDYFDSPECVKEVRVGFNMAMD